MMDINEQTKAYIDQLIATNPILVKEHITKNGEFFQHRELFFKLKSYVDKILEGDSWERFFLMAGLRGVGKSTSILQLYYYLYSERNIEPKRLLYLDLERAKDIPNFNLQNVLDYFIRDINNADPVLEKPIFIFVDESQYYSNWASCGKIIYDEQKKVFMIFTGSDALNIQSNHVSARRALHIPVFPLNFNEFLNLKYGIYIDNTDIFQNMLFSGDITESSILEKTINNNYLLNAGIDKNKIFKYYLQYGGFPFCINNSISSILDLTINFKDRIIEKDLVLFNKFNSSTILAAYKLVNFLANQGQGEVSLSRLSKILGISKDTVNSLLSAFERIQLLFHIEPYGSVSKRIRKSWEYYFLAPQMKAAIYLTYGQALGHSNEFFGNLSENMVASILFKIKYKLNNMFSIYYDPRKGGVDFLFNDIMGNVIPIEVGYGKKDKKQIKSAINNYNSDYGIIVSNRTSTIEKEDNIISIPLSTFCFI